MDNKNINNEEDLIDVDSAILDFDDFISETDGFGESLDIDDPYIADAEKKSC